MGRRNRVSAMAALISVGLIGTVAAMSFGRPLAGVADPHPDPSLVRVSGPSPFIDCQIGAPSFSGADTVTPNAAVEPTLAANPTTVGTNHVNLLGGWQEDPWATIGSRGLVAAYSFDGGQHWGRTVLPFSACAPGGLGYARAADLWFSFGPDGTAYAAALAFTFHGTSFFPEDSAVVAAASTDGGRTWGAPALIEADDNTSQYFNDKVSVTADPTRAGVAYIVWDRNGLPTDNTASSGHSFAFRGSTLFAKTTDGGRSWSRPTIIAAAGQNNQTFGNQIVVDPRVGTLYNFFDWIKATGPNGDGQHGDDVAFARSTDGGVTWSPPRIIASLQSVGVVDPNTGAQIRAGDLFPEPAVDPASGRLYVAWDDARFSGGRYDEIALSSSSDGGIAWSAPIRINTPSGRAAFLPSIQVNAAGVVGVSYADFRNLAAQASTLPADYWLVTSTDGGTHFGDETHLAGPFDMLMAPDAGGHFVGDYVGLAAAGSSFHPFLALTNPAGTPDVADIYTTAIIP